MDLLDPEDVICGKLIKVFVELKGEEPQNPNALYRLVSETVKEKASYEFDLGTYEEVVKSKGVTRTEFDKMLETYKKESKKDYINKQLLKQRRKYNAALVNLLDMPQSENLNLTKIKIFNYIKEHKNTLDNVDCYLENISIFICFIYASGDEI